MYILVSHASHPQRVEFQRSPIWGVLLYLCLHPLTQNDQILHSNTQEWACFRTSAIYVMSSWLHKCIARFVSDKGKRVHTLDIAPLRSESPPQKHSGMARVLKGFHSFTCAPTRSSAIGMSHTCLCLPSHRW